MTVHKWAKIGSRTSNTPRASGDKVNTWSLSYSLREVNHYNHNWNVKWTMKHFLHY